MGFFDFLGRAFTPRRGKTYTDERGYPRFQDSGKLVDRYAAAKRIGRPLRQEEVVHHIDRDKTNNSRRNLWVFRNQGAHSRAHKEDARTFGRKASYKGFKKRKSLDLW